jgi:hypothetical protein
VIAAKTMREEEFFFRQLRDVRLLQQVVAAQDRFRLTEEVPEEAAVGYRVNRLAKAHLETDKHPENEHDREGDERHHHRVHRPPLLHHPAIEDNQAGNAHQPHKGGGGELP